jgi:hypothetical protein
MANFTLHQGGATQTFEEHPVEVARKALLAAAEVESSRWSGILLRFAEALPERGRMVRGRDD